MKHREQLKSQRRRSPSLKRGAPSLNQKPVILIVCEGSHTEPSYFNQFRLASARIKTVGEGFNTLSLVIRAIEIAKEEKYDQVWCVFDRDDFRETDFNGAIELAERNGFGVAYSIQSFEYWLILHFNDHQGGGINRSSYNQILNDLLQPFGVKYEGRKSKLISEDLFDLFNGIDLKTGKRRVELAIERAERNYSRFDHRNPAREESSTTVFRLVKALLIYTK